MREGGDAPDLALRRDAGCSPGGAGGRARGDAHGITGRVQAGLRPFFGRPAGCDRSAGVLIRRVGAPLVFYGCYGIPGVDPLKSWRFELRFTRVIFPEDLAGLGPVEIATRVNQELERLLLHRPQQVFWLHDRFKGAPDSGRLSGEGAVLRARRRAPCLFRPRGERRGMDAGKLSVDAADRTLPPARPEAP